MKSKELLLLQMVLLASALSICLSGCTISGHWRLPVVWVDEHHRAPVHRYYYYPDQGVYYDPGPSVYYWRENDNWRSDRRLPKQVKVNRRRRYRFDSDADRPYNVHDRVAENVRSRDHSRQPNERSRGR